MASISFNLFAKANSIGVRLALERPRGDELGRLAVTTVIWDGG